jgi:hypothetical protein
MGWIRLLIGALICLGLVDQWQSAWFWTITGLVLLIALVFWGGAGRNNRRTRIDLTD